MVLQRLTEHHTRVDLHTLLQFGMGQRSRLGATQERQDRSEPLPRGGERLIHPRRNVCFHQAPFLDVRVSTTTNLRGRSPSFRSGHAGNRCCYTTLRTFSRAAPDAFCLRPRRLPTTRRPAAGTAVSSRGGGV